MLCVIGCGNSTRSDDGVGVFVAQTLQAYLKRQPHVYARVFDAGTAGMDVMFQARGARKLIIVDASKSGSDAGAIFKVPGQELESMSDPGYSLHDFRWQHALAAGRRIFGADFPTDVTVFLVEAHSLSFGLDLSPPVLASAHRVIRDIQSAIQQYPQPEASLIDNNDCGSTMTPVAPDGLHRSVVIAHGSFYLSRELCDTYLRGVVSVALLAREQIVLIVPLTQQSGGGLLLKQRNARGDRVIHAQEFFRDKGFLEDFEERTASAHWSPESAALVVTGLARTDTTAGSTP